MRNEELGERGEGVRFDFDEALGVIAKIVLVIIGLCVAAGGAGLAIMVLKTAIAM